MTRSSSRSIAWAALLALASTPTFGAGAAPVVVSAPMKCSRGPDFPFKAIVTMPSTGVTGATFTVRIDSGFSGKVSATGLHYIHDMLTDFVVPAGTSYVDGSLRFVEGSGTPNAREGARAWRDPAGIHFVLPVHIPNGASYTPPSIELALKIEAPAGATIAMQFLHYQLAANAFLVGDLDVRCDPTPKPYTLGELRVVAPASP
jgi:hypothetical protein